MRFLKIKISSEDIMNHLKKKIDIKCLNIGLEFPVNQQSLTEIKKTGN